MYFPVVAKHDHGVDIEDAIDWVERGQLARAARKKRNWTQKDLADAVDVSPRTVTTLENGRAISKANWVAVARSLGLIAPRPTQIVVARDSVGDEAARREAAAEQHDLQTVAEPAVRIALTEVQKQKLLDPTAMTEEQLLALLGEASDELQRRAKARAEQYALAADDEQPRASREPQYDDGGV